jgi:phosphoribosyl 1,2-cyclic phosphodiesterase
VQFIAHHSSSAGNLYQVKSESGNLIIDPGVTIAKIKKDLGFNLSSIDAAIVSHCHGDHSKGVPGLAKAGVDCYMLQETADAIKFSGHRLSVITPMEQFAVKGLKILPFPAQHDVPNVGFLISDGKDKLMFLVDSFYCKYRFNGLTIIAMAVNWSRETILPTLNPTRRKRLYKSHMNLESAVKMLKANDLSTVREIHLLHLSSDNSDPEFFCDTIRKATGKPTYRGGKRGTH